METTPDQNPENEGALRTVQAAGERALANMGPVVEGPVRVSLIVGVMPQQDLTPGEAVEQAIQYIASEGLRNFAYSVLAEQTNDEWLVYDGHVVSDEELEAAAGADDDQSQ